MDKIILLTRPLLTSQEDSLAWEQAGFKTFRTPLLKIVFLKKVVLPDLKNYQAVITTSSAAIQALASLTVNRNLHLWCVGKASYQIAEKLGFQNIFISSSKEENAASLLTTLLQNLNPIEGSLLYLTGEFVHLDLKIELSQHSFKVDKIVIYEAQPCLESWPVVHSHLKENLVKGITFYSQRTASLFKDFMCAYNLEVIENCYPLCLSSSISNTIQPFFMKSPIIASTTAQLIANLEKILQSG